jgi:mono/diheme cytochrome c family protein
MKTFSIIILLGSFVGSLGLMSCSGTHSEPNIEVIQDMMDQPSIKAQEYDETSPNHSGMRVPPEGTVPQGFTPYKYGNDVERAAKENKNPLEGQNSQEVIMTGQKFFETNCMVCHGMHGQGGEQGNSIGEKMARKPPSLLSDKVRAFTDGQIYHIISKGQGVMGPYESHIPQAYRWQVVNYIRQLQKNATK